MATGGPGTLEAKMWGTLHGPGTLAATIWGTLNFSGSLPCKRAFVLSASTARLSRPRPPWRSATVWTSLVDRRVAWARARSSGCGWTPTRPPDGRHLSGGVAPAASGLTLLTAAPGLTLPPGGMHLPGVWAPAATDLTLLTAATCIMLLTCSGRSSPPHPDGMHLSGGGDV
jgi:hypothetical protein